LLIGVLVFTFYQYTKPPVFFNSFELNKLEKSAYAGQLNDIKAEHQQVFESKQQELDKLGLAIDQGDDQVINKQRTLLLAADAKEKEVRKKATDLMLKNDANADTNDNNYIFLSFVTEYLPKGLIGLLIAIIFLASMGSTASALNSLASTSVIDIYKRLIKKDGSDEQYLKASRWLTFFWGFVCILMALYASKIGNLIEAVNVLGSYIYGTILGVFLVAFYLKHVNGRSVFIAAIIAEITVCICGYLQVVAYLWLNVIGCLLVVALSLLLQAIPKRSFGTEDKST